ncbi:hypothetical protein GOP47_0016791 [Adiantum capillus-veneris]|uniref:Phosphatidylethanolamine-binding protein n=1 Tax=Adiantum capillus-veneris TaxID=13818 RepID=A0A9D4UJB5_ADICA|nr:hypothetical protein GOP47_0016791 [Adiantum capillus-veneris]
MATPGSGVPVTKEQLEKAKIVPGVVSSLGSELVDLRVLYKELEVVNGLALRKAQTQIKPHVELHGPSAGSAHDFYTLLMVDPDAPSPTKPSFRNFLHWLVVNIPGSVAPSQEVWQLGQEGVEYMGPAPPEGEHRYVFLLFKQSSGDLKLEGLNKENRKSFDVEAFAKAHKLGPAIGGLYYVTTAHDELGHSGKQV